MWNSVQSNCKLSKELLSHSDIYKLTASVKGILKQKTTLTYCLLSSFWVIQARFSWLSFKVSQTLAPHISCSKCKFECFWCPRYTPPFWGRFGISCSLWQSFRHFLSPDNVEKSIFWNFSISFYYFFLKVCGINNFDSLSCLVS